jgi:hypothetical protein
MKTPSVSATTAMNNRLRMKTPFGGEVGVKQ